MLTHRAESAAARRRIHAPIPASAPKPALGIPPRLELTMAKGQRKSNKEIRKPKKEGPPKQNASQPSLKQGGIKGLENIKNR
jgi:hypothetical protein